MDEIKYSYDGKFEVNILVVGRTSFGKIPFEQNLGKKVVWRRKNGLLDIENYSLTRERRKNDRIF